MNEPALNVLGTELIPCSYDPLTGYFRDGCCKTDHEDHGSHVVCARITQDFLDFSLKQGNDLITPRPEFRFKGLKHGDKWCLCALRWKEERHFVYVIELDKDVLYDSKFKKANPNYEAGKPCVYVGMTGHDPDTRFDQHKAGIKANKYAMKYGLRLMPEIYEKLNPMPYSDAQYMEVDLAIRLQNSGYGVWQN